jgi:hypothetical protein
MRFVEFHRYLNDDNALRVEFELEHGQVLKFVVQLECRFGASGELTPVVRYDTAHGFAHCDRLHLKIMKRGQVLTWDNLQC